jgi:tripartite-type tricarboxylate transporter receptor subunit TctC
MKTLSTRRHLFRRAFNFALQRSCFRTAMTACGGGQKKAASYTIKKVLKGRKAAMVQHANRFIGTFIALAFLCAPGHATAQSSAQAWPSKPIRWIVPYTPGGYTDIVTRRVTQKLAEALGQSIVIENRSGANSVIGADIVAKAPPDGYTFGTVIAAHAVNATLYPKLPFDSLKDFTYVSLMSVAPLIMVAHPSLPANNVKELIAYAKANPGKLNFGSSGVGAAAHLTMEMFKSRVGISMVHVPYKGTMPALQDAIGGQINLMFDVVGPLITQVRADKLKAIVVTAKERMAAAPEVPTMAESGVPNFVSGTWAGAIAPAGVPKDIVNRISGEIAKVLRDPAIREDFAKQGYEAVGGSPEQYLAFYRSEVALWAKVIKDSGTKAEE